MPSPTYALAVDLAGDQLFDSTDVLTADVVSQGGQPGEKLFASVRGHDSARVLSQPRAGDAAFLLDNTGGEYSAGGTLVPGRKVRLRATYAGTTYDLLRGLLDRPRQLPINGMRKLTEVRVLGQMSRLAGRKVSTALYSSITTGTALGHLLDAVSYPRNLPQYILNDLDSLLGYWRLGETSGVMADSSANANNGTWTAGMAGLRGQTAIDDGGDLSAFFDGDSTTGTGVSIGDPAVLREMFAAGGSIAALVNISGAGGFSVGRLISKAIPGTSNLWLLRTVAPAGANVALEFVHRWSGGEAIWRTTVDIPISTPLLVALVYNSDATANDPTIYVVNLSTGGYTAYTVGSGLTETAAPSGTLTADSGQTLIIGNVNSGSNSTFHGRIDEIHLVSDLLTAAEIKAMASRAMDAPRHIDTGKTTMDYWWLDNEDAFAALNTLKATEGPGCALYEDGTGAIVFKDRHARVTDTRSTTSQTTFSSIAGAAEPLLSLPFEHDDGTADVVNDCTIDVKVRTLASLAQVWALGSTVTLAPDETRKYQARQSDSDPFSGAVAPTTGGGDYAVASGSLASVPTLDRTSGGRVTITLVGGAAGASITGLRLRAQSLDVSSIVPIAATAVVAASQARYGVRSYPLAIRAEIAVNTAQDLCNAIVGYQQDGRATAAITVKGIQSASRLTAALVREVSDRVTIVNAGAGMNGAFYIESVAHRVDAPSAHTTTFACEEASAATAFLIDTSSIDGADLIWF